MPAAAGGGAGSGGSRGAAPVAAVRSACCRGCGGGGRRGALCRGRHHATRGSRHVWQPTRHTGLAGRGLAGRGPYLPAQLQEHAGGRPAGFGAATDARHRHLHSHPHRGVQLPRLAYLLRCRHSHHPRHRQQQGALCGWRRQRLRLCPDPQPAGAQQRRRQRAACQQRGGRQQQRRPPRLAVGIYSKQRSTLPACLGRRRCR